VAACGGVTKDVRPRAAESREGGHAWNACPGPCPAVALGLDAVAAAGVLIRLRRPTDCDSIASCAVPNRMCLLLGSLRTCLTDRLGATRSGPRTLAMGCKPSGAAGSQTAERSLESTSGSQGTTPQRAHSVAASSLPRVHRVLRSVAFTLSSLKPSPCPTTSASLQAGCVESSLPACPD